MLGAMACGCGITVLGEKRFLGGEVGHSVVDQFLQHGFGNGFALATGERLIEFVDGREQAFVLIVQGSDIDTIFFRPAKGRGRSVHLSVLWQSSGVLWRGISQYQSVMRKVTQITNYTCNCRAIQQPRCTSVKASRRLLRLLIKF